MSVFGFMLGAHLFLPRAPSALRSEVTVEIRAGHNIEGKFGALWTSECESECEEKFITNRKPFSRGAHCQ